MATHSFHSIVVSGINDGDEQPSIERAHRRALDLFESDLVSPLTEVGHNFVQSFCIFPSGSGNQRPAQVEHENAIAQFCKDATAFGVDFVAIRWTDDLAPEITGSHDSQ